MVEWVALIAGATAGSALIANHLQRRRARRREASGQVPIAHLLELSGSSAVVVGRVEAEASLSPLTFHPCAAWWCWISGAQAPGAGPLHELGAAVHGEFRLVDRSGELPLTASQCLPPHGASFELRLTAAEWPAPGSSTSHDTLREVCSAAGIEHPEAFAELLFTEALLPLKVTLQAVGLVVPGQGEDSGLYRQGKARTATLGPPPGGFIELAPR